APGGRKKRARTSRLLEAGTTRRSKRLELLATPVVRCTPIDRSQRFLGRAHVPQCAPGTEIERARKLGPRWTVSPIPRASRGYCASLCFGVPGLAGLDGSWRTFPEGGLGRETGFKGLKIPVSVVRFRPWAP